MTKPKISAIVKLDEIVSRLQQARKYSFIIFIVFVVGIYGFVLYRINSLSSVQPSDDAINSQVQAAQVPKIDQNVVSQLKSLQDNSVNVQSLFDKARTSPFQESIQ
jgi:hypothetical protein